MNLNHILNDDRRIAAKLPQSANSSSLSPGSCRTPCWPSIVQVNPGSVLPSLVASTASASSRQPAGTGTLGCSGARSETVAMPNPRRWLSTNLYHTATQCRGEPLYSQPPIQQKCVFAEPEVQSSALGHFREITACATARVIQQVHKHHEMRNLAPQSEQHCWQPTLQSPGPAPSYPSFPVATAYAGSHHAALIPSPEVSPATTYHGAHPDNAHPGNAPHAPTDDRPLHDSSSAYAHQPPPMPYMALYPHEKSHYYRHASATPGHTPVLHTNGQNPLVPADVTPGPYSHLKDPCHQQCQGENVMAPRYQAAEPAKRDRGQEHPAYSYGIPAPISPQCYSLACGNSEATSIGAVPVQTPHALITCAAVPARGRDSLPLTCGPSNFLYRLPDAPVPSCYAGVPLIPRERRVASNAPSNPTRDNSVVCDWQGATDTKDILSEASGRGDAPLSLQRCAPEQVHQRNKGGEGTVERDRCKAVSTDGVGNEMYPRHEITQSPVADKRSDKLEIEDVLLIEPGYRSLGISEVSSDLHGEYRERKSLSLPPADPAVPFPKTCVDFNGVPESCVGDVLHVWDFVVSFCRVLRLSPCSLPQFEASLASAAKNPILDSLLVRLVYTFLSDEGMVGEMKLDTQVVAHLTRVKPSQRKDSVDLVLSSLPSLLSFEVDANDVNHKALADVVSTLYSSSDVFAFYHVIDTAGRLRVLRELVDIACMSEKIRDCVQDSMEHAADERKKLRDEVLAKRRKLEQQLKELREELDVYRISHSLNSVSDDEDRVEGLRKKLNGTAAGSAQDTGLVKGDENRCDEDSQSPNPNQDRADPVQCKQKKKNSSRTERLQAAKRERIQEQERRVVERREGAIESKIEKVRAALKALRNVRLRQPRDNVRRDVALNGSHTTGCNEKDRVLALGSIQDKDSDPVRTYPLGEDRFGRGYWFLPDVGRLWIEDPAAGSWCYIKDRQAVATLLSWLSPSRPAEVALARAIESHNHAIEAAMKAKSTVPVVRMEPSSSAGDSSDGCEVIYCENGKQLSLENAESATETPTQSEKEAVPENCTSSSRASVRTSIQTSRHGATVEGRGTEAGIEVAKRRPSRQETSGATTNPRDSAPVQSAATKRSQSISKRTDKKFSRGVSTKSPAPRQQTRFTQAAKSGIFKSAKSVPQGCTLTQVYSGVQALRSAVRSKVAEPGQLTHATRLGAAEASAYTLRKLDRNASRRSFRLRSTKETPVHDDTAPPAPGAKTQEAQRRSPRKPVPSSRKRSAEEQATAGNGAAARRTRLRKTSRRV